MVESALAKARVSAPVIGHHQRSGSDGAFDESAERICATAGDDGDTNTSRKRLPMKIVDPSNLNLGYTVNPECLMELINYDLRSFGISTSLVALFLKSFFKCNSTAITRDQVMFNFHLSMLNRKWNIVVLLLSLLCGLISVPLYDIFGINAGPYMFLFIMSVIVIGIIASIVERIIQNKSRRKRGGR